MGTARRLVALQAEGGASHTRKNLQLWKKAAQSNTLPARVDPVSPNTISSWSTQESSAFEDLENKHSVKLTRSLNRKTAVSRSVEDWCEVAVGNDYGGSTAKGYATWKELEGVAKDLYDSPVIESAIQEWWRYMGFEVSGRMSKDEYTMLCTCLQQTLAPEEKVDEEKLNIVASAEWDRNYGKYAVTVGFKEFKKEIFSLVSCWTMEHDEDAFELFLKSKMQPVGDYLAARRAANPSRFKKGAKATRPPPLNTKALLEEDSLASLPSPASSSSSKGSSAVMNGEDNAAKSDPGRSNTVSLCDASEESKAAPVAEPTIKLVIRIVPELLDTPGISAASSTGISVGISAGTSGEAEGGNPTHIMQDIGVGCDTVDEVRQVAIMVDVPVQTVPPEPDAAPPEPPAAVPENPAPEDIDMPSTETQEESSPPPLLGLKPASPKPASPNWRHASPPYFSPLDVRRPPPLDVPLDGQSNSPKVIPYDTMHEDDPYWAPPLNIFPRRVSDPVIRLKPASYCPENLHPLPDSEGSLAETELSYDAPSVVESFEKSFASSDSVSEQDEPEATMFGRRRDPLALATVTLGDSPSATLRYTQGEQFGLHQVAVGTASDEGMVDQPPRAVRKGKHHRKRHHHHHHHSQRDAAPAPRDLCSARRRVTMEAAKLGLTVVERTAEAPEPAAETCEVLVQQTPQHASVQIGQPSACQDASPLVNRNGDPGAGPDQFLPRGRTPSGGIRGVAHRSSQAPSPRVSRSLRGRDPESGSAAPMTSPAASAGSYQLADFNSRARKIMDILLGRDNHDPLSSSPATIAAAAAAAESVGWHKYTEARARVQGHRDFPFVSRENLLHEPPSSAQLHARKHGEAPLAPRENLLHDAPAARQAPTPDQHLQSGVQVAMTRTFSPSREVRNALLSPPSHLTARQGSPQSPHQVHNVRPIKAPLIVSSWGELNSLVSERQKQEIPCSLRLQHHTLNSSRDRPGQPLRTPTFRLQTNPVSDKSPSRSFAQ